MLTKKQIKRLLAQCERIDLSFGDAIPTGLQTEWSRNIGWIQALRLVLEKDTYPIRKFKGKRMSEWKVTVKAIISVDDPDTLSKLILCRMITDEADEETISAIDDDFEVVEYPEDWLDFTEIMKRSKND